MVATIEFALLVEGFIFVWNSILDYMSGITTFTVDKEPLSLLDVPTITFCLESRLIPTAWNRTNFKNDVLVENGQESKSHSLMENE